MDKPGVLPTRRAADTELRRHLKPARELCEYPIERVRQATLRAMKLTPEWVLQTVLKEINKV